MKVIWQKSFHWQINGEMKTRLICVSPWGTVVFIRAEHRAARRRKSLTIPMSHGYRCNYLDALMHLHGQSAKEECALSLNSLSRWHLKFSVWIWISDCALHLQTVGFGARETLRWLRCQSLPVFEPRGPMWGRRSGGGAGVNKNTPACKLFNSRLRVWSLLARRSFILVISAQTKRVTPTNQTDAGVDL